MEPNTTSDKEILDGRSHITKESTGLNDMVADGAFALEDVYEAAKKEKINIRLTVMCGKASSKKMEAREFKTDETGAITECPEDRVPERLTISNGQLVANFMFETYEPYPLDDVCYNKTLKKKHRIRISLRAMASSKCRLEKEWAWRNWE